MQLYQWANLITATACALVFIVVARKTNDKISKGAMTVWAICMFFAALAGPLIAFTHYDAQIQLVSRIVTPAGWTALAVCAARRLVVR